MTESLLEAPAKETTAQRVLRIRTSLGLRQRELARDLGVSERSVIRWERGARVRKVYLDRLDDMLAAKEHDAEQA